MRHRPAAPRHLPSWPAPAAWVALLALALLLHATVGRGLHELRHLRPPSLGAWSLGAQASAAGQPDDAADSAEGCTWCLSQAHAAPGSEPPLAVAVPLRHWSPLLPRPAAAPSDATRWPFAARAPPHGLG